MKRLTNIDAVKTFAVFTVFICHFCRTIEYYGTGGVKVFFPTNIFNVYTGTVGSALFFIVSGFLLEYHGYHDVSIRQFYGKRFRRLYPMFWIATVLWGIVTAVENVILGREPSAVPWYRIIYTILGVDNIAESYELTFKQVGEWFLGVIIILYLLYPLLSFLINKSGLLFAAIAAATLWIGCAVIPNHYLPLGKEFMEGILLFAYGIFFARYIREVKLPLALVSSAAIGILSFCELPSSLSVIQVDAVGISLFNILLVACSDIKQTGIVHFNGLISRYCYPIFLIHHRVMFLITWFFRGLILNVAELWLLFFVEAGAVMVGSWLLLKITDCITGPHKRKNNAAKAQSL